MAHHAHTGHPVRPKMKWWQWVAVGLMLLAIGTYVVTLDDSLQPQIDPPAAAPSAGR